MTKLEEGRSATRDLERIRALMERATEWSNLSGWSVVISGLLASAGAAACFAKGADFELPGHARTLALVWGAVFAAAAVQGVGFSVANSRRKAEPAWSPLTRQVVVAMLPALFTGAALTGYGFTTGQLDLLPPCWMLAYGSSLMGLGLFAGRPVRVAALAFLAFGAASLFLWKDRGLLTMLASFGGIHLALGAWMLWKPRA
ncbi:MAG: hypothetical protein HY293_15785 [Planctomycetes bacterium]|nr:hypothetical protein [Planctomycetota bacterium]